eukprot:TRINITY_DN28578_c0_g1_i1.p2 TRINITY_DN28578_c0_g1~~TRINITY_DN28578_c0_g1_i1.p2  ORF type:complete len:105 (-),score=63.01 TRINITY_DN28578_c0_g1_i1:97-411(-)
MATKVSKSVGRPAGKRGSKKARTWSIYINRTLKDITKDKSLSGKSMLVVNSFINDIFERIAVQAASLTRANKKKTLGSSEMQTCLLYTSPSPRDRTRSRMPSSA